MLKHCHAQNHFLEIIIRNGKWCGNYGFFGVLGS